MGLTGTRFEQASSRAGADQIDGGMKKDEPT